MQKEFKMSSARMQNARIQTLAGRVDLFQALPVLLPAFHESAHLGFLLFQLGLDLFPTLPVSERSGAEIMTW